METEITYLRCYLALSQFVKEEFGTNVFERYKHILAEVMGKFGLWKSIDDKEALKRIGLENEIENPNLVRLINEIEYCYAHTGRIYFFDNKNSIPFSDERYLLFLTICLNNFSDTNVEKILEYQFSINPNKKEFLKKLRLCVRENAGKIIPHHKVETAFEWIDATGNSTLYGVGKDEGKEKQIVTEAALINGKGKTELKLHHNFSIIIGKLAKEQIDIFFSFLYLESGRDGKPFLSAGDVAELLKYGLVIYKNESEKKYNLNISKNQKGIIQYCFYELFSQHQDSINIKEDIIKFLTQNFIQFNGMNVKNLSKNTTGEKPRNIKFDISKYLP